MDNVTHTLFALTLARTRLARGGRGTTAALVLASNAPDIDIISTVGGGANYLVWHRGPTHGPLGILGLGLLTAALVWSVGRFSPTTRKDPDTAVASFSTLLLVSVVGVTAHILMDLPTSYGTRLLSPFNWHWFAIDWLPIIDIYLLAALAGGLVFGLVSGNRAVNAAIALALMAGNYGVRGVAHHEALALAPRLFGPTLPQACDSETSTGSLVDSWPLDTSTRSTAFAGSADSKRCLLELAALPTFLSPFRWRVIAHLSDSYEMQDVNVLDGRFRVEASPSEAFWRLAVRFPNQWTPPVAQAAGTRTAQIFLGFSRLADVRTFVDHAGVTTVEWTDMRFLDGLPNPRQQARLATPFTVTVRLGPERQILQEKLGP